MYMEGQLPLAGYKVLDFTRLLPGSFCTMLLADYGAEVIKVEDTGRGDYSRNIGVEAGGQSLTFAQLNRNKKSISVDLKTEAGKQIINNLIEKSDVLIESFRPGTTKRIGIDYESAKEVNSQIIYCSITGYGQDGPYSDKAGHDINYLALSGLLSLNGKRNSSPVIPAVQIADIGSGALMATTGILMALLFRVTTKQGNRIDVSMTDGLLNWQSVFLPEYLFKGNDLQRGELLLSGGLACYNIYETGDGEFMSLGALEEKFWRNFCTVVEKKEWVDKQYCLEAQPQLIEEVQSLFAGKSREYWEQLFTGKDVCCEPVLSLKEVSENPQFQYRKMFIDIPHPSGRVKQVNSPLKFNNARARTHSFSPYKGEQTVEILRSMGYRESEITGFREQGIIDDRHDK